MPHQAHSTFFAYPGLPDAYRCRTAHRRDLFHNRGFPDRYTCSTTLGCQTRIGVAQPTEGDEVLAGDEGLGGCGVVDPRLDHVKGRKTLHDAPTDVDVRHRLHEVLSVAPTKHFDGVDTNR